MKNIYLILAGILLVSESYTQSTIELKAKDHSGIPIVSGSSQTEFQNTSRSIITNHTVNFNDEHENYYSSTSAGGFRTIFPDSTTPGQYTGTVVYTYIHGAAQIFDLSSEVVNSGVGGLTDGFDPSQNSTLDSIKIFGYYAKGSYNHVDTLEVSVINYIGDFIITGATAIAWGTDTIRAFAIEFDTNTYEVKNVISTYKFPLKLSDTLANGTMYSKIPAGATVGSRFAIDVRYIPGGTHSVTDTINKQLGMYRIYASEPNGTGTKMSYIKNDRSGAAFFTKFAKYDNTPPRRRYYGNVYNYTDGQSDNFEIEAVLSQTNSVSIQEKNKDAQLFQNYPNPTSGITTVSYSLQNKANVSFEMMDVAGKKVISSIEGNRNPGTYSIEINTSELNSGIYFYSVEVNGNRITKKMIVSN